MNVSPTSSFFVSQRPKSGSKHCTNSKCLWTFNKASQTQILAFFDYCLLIRVVESLVVYRNCDDGLTLVLGNVFETSLMRLNWATRRRYGSLQKSFIKQGQHLCRTCQVHRSWKCSKCFCRCTTSGASPGHVQFKRLTI